MIDEKITELSASNTLLVSQSEATKSQLSSLEIILTETTKKFRETEGVLEVFRSELNGWVVSKGWMTIFTVFHLNMLNG